MSDTSKVPVQVVLTKYVVDFDNDKEYKVVPPNDDVARALIVSKLQQNPKGKFLIVDLYEHDPNYQVPMSNEQLLEKLAAMQQQLDVATGKKVASQKNEK